MRITRENEWNKMKLLHVLWDEQIFGVNAIVRMFICLIKTFNDFVFIIRSLS